MKFEIKSRFSGSILFSLETESLKLCVEAAVKSGAYLRGADLSGADLSCAYLSCADFGGAYLSGADLSGAYLSGADLRGAYLRGADLRGAYLRGADLSGADLSCAYLSCADLRGADFRGADLSGADFRGADFRGAKLTAKDGTDLILVGERPCLQIGPLGSRSDYLFAFLTDRGVYIKAGCFFDTLAVFKDAVCETHGTSDHAIEYAATTALIEYHAQCWTPKVTL